MSSQRSLIAFRNHGVYLSNIVGQKYFVLSQLFLIENQVGSLVDIHCLKSSFRPIILNGRKVCLSLRKLNCLPQNFVQLLSKTLHVQRNNAYQIHLFQVNRVRTDELLNFVPVELLKKIAAQNLYDIEKPFYFLVFPLQLG